MYRWNADWTGDDLHWFLAGAVSSKVSEVFPPGTHHSVPVEQHFTGERPRKGPIEIDHHFGNALFRRQDAAFIGRRQSELTQYGRLHTGSIEDFAFNGRCGHGLPGHCFHEEMIAFVLAQMLDCANSNARAKEELLFGSRISAGGPI